MIFNNIFILKPYYLNFFCFQLQNMRKILLCLIFGALFVWMFYDILSSSKGKHNLDSNEEIKNKFDKGNKWYYLQSKLIALLFIILGFLIFVIVKFFL